MRVFHVEERMTKSDKIEQSMGTIDTVTESMDKRIEADYENQKTTRHERYTAAIIELMNELPPDLYEEALDLMKAQYGNVFKSWKTPIILGSQGKRTMDLGEILIDCIEETINEWAERMADED